MRLALALRNRRRLLMQVDSPQKVVSSFFNSHKRSFTQQATATAPLQSKPLSSKVPRVDNPPPSSSFSFSKRTTTAPHPPVLVSPPFEMPHSSHQPSSKSSRGFGLRASQSVGHGSSHRLTPKGRGGKSIARKLLDAPLHNQAYIAREYGNFQLPLKPIHENAPKSSLGNFSMLSIGKLPSYKTVEGLVADGLHGQTMQIWRQVLLRISSSSIS
jgi:small subunit ribosomal protein S24e